MKKILIYLSRIAGLAVAFVIILLGVATVMLNVPSVQKQVADYATELLAEKLQTKVAIDSVRLNFFQQEIGLYGVGVEDREQRKMLDVKSLAVAMKWLPLLRRQVVVTDVKLEGVEALLLKPSKEDPANYQFVIDAFKKDKKQPEEKAPRDSTKKKFTLDVSHVNLRDIKVRYNDNDVALVYADYSKDWMGRHTATVNGLTAVLGKYDTALQKLSVTLQDSTCKATIEGVTARWEAVLKKGPQRNEASLAVLSAELHGLDSILKPKVQIKEFCFKTDNHKPRKNQGKPKKGFFDTGHLDITANMDVDVDYLTKDSLHARLTNGKATDKKTGFDIKGLQLAAATDFKRIHMTGIKLKQADTDIAIDHADLRLPNKKKGVALSYSTGNIAIRVLLKDIARPFAPVLANFTMPLQVTTRLNGNDDGMDFHNVRVQTTDRKLWIAAKGSIRNMKDKYQLAVRFHVDTMFAKAGIKETIISQFPVKKMMMKQLHALGDITYTGDFAVLWKKECFKGLLRTVPGNIIVNDLTLDEADKYVIGNVSTKTFNVGKALDLPSLGLVDCDATFKIDISKPRTAIMRKQKGGHLPIGNAEIHITDIKYKLFHIRNILTTLNSDGALAEGEVVQKGKRRDLFCSFSFTNTDQMRKMKVKPGIKFHKKEKTN